MTAAEKQEVKESGLPQRKLGALLDETFSLYSKNFRQFVVMVAVVQVPIGVVSALILALFREGLAPLLVAELMGIVGAVAVYGAIASGVGQKYISGEIDIRSCYDRAIGRLRSLALIGLLVWGGLFVIPTLETLIEDQTVAAIVGILTIPIIAFAIYWSMSIQISVVEGHKAVSALRRSFRLVQGSWWRVFGIHMVVGLVIIGLMIILNLAFLPLTYLPGVENAFGAINLVTFLAGLVVTIIAPPILFIAGTLLYYDLRVRKEDYDFAALSQEMGFAAA